MEKQRNNFVGYILLAFSVLLFITGQIVYYKLQTDWCNACDGISGYSTPRESYFMPIEDLFNRFWGYVFLAIFFIAGIFIRPRTIGIIMAIIVYIVLAFLFTFIYI